MKVLGGRSLPEHILITPELRNPLFIYHQCMQALVGQAKIIAQSSD
jgi:hypothetical protein